MVGRVGCEGRGRERDGGRGGMALWIGGAGRGAPPFRLRAARKDRAEAGGAGAPAGPSAAAAAPFPGLLWSVASAPAPEPADPPDLCRLGSFPTPPPLPRDGTIPRPPLLRGLPPRMCGTGDGGGAARLSRCSSSLARTLPASALARRYRSRSLARTAAPPSPPSSRYRPMISSHAWSMASDVSRMEAPRAWPPAPAALGGEASGATMPVDILCQPSAAFVSASRVQSPEWQ